MRKKRNKVIIPEGAELMDYLNRGFAICNRCGAVMDRKEGSSAGPASGGRHIVPEDQAVVASFVLYELHRISALVLILHFVNLPSARWAGVNIAATSRVFPHCKASCKMFDD